MKKLTILLAILVTGCATTKHATVPNAGITKLQAVTKHTATILDEQEGTIVKLEILSDKATLDNKDIRDIAKSIEAYYKTK